MRKWQTNDSPMWSDRASVAITTLGSVVFLTALFWAVGFVAREWAHELDDADGVPGAEVIIDLETGCHYLRVGRHFVPRTLPDGSQLCREEDRRGLHSEKEE